MRNISKLKEKLKIEVKNPQNSSKKVKTSAIKLKTLFQKTQNSSKKLKVSANLIGLPAQIGRIKKPGLKVAKLLSR